MRFNAKTLFGLSAWIITTVVPWSTVEAGCGCEKAPPVVASVRPSVTYAGSDVDLFHPNLNLGEAYEVRFESAAGGEVAVSGTGWERRDLADGVVKAHVTVAVPRLALGPAAIEVRDSEGILVMSVDSADFTVAPDPIAITEAFGMNRFEDYRAAVDADGTVYVSIDLSAVRKGRTMDIWGKSFPLRFGAEDVAFYNVQGFLMQLLDTPVPGLLAFDVADRGPKDSSALRYFRHEFETYFAAHEERDTHAVDPSDDDWHLDGTPHIDHNHLIVAIAGVYADGSRPSPGATAPFDLTLNAIPEETLDSPEPLEFRTVEDSITVEKSHNVETSTKHAQLEDSSRKPRKTKTKRTR